jgi:Flp pilus assembly protein TadG
MIGHADERGSFTIWALGLCVTLLFLGGIAIDAWRMFGARRELTNATEAAARAGATGIDEDRLRDEGVLTLDRSRVDSLARESLASPSNTARLDGPPVVQVENFTVTVRASTTVELPLIGLLSPGGARRTMHASAQAQPHTG